jgi:GNAT superfamily N-acetyltransferase
LNFTIKRLGAADFQEYVDLVDLVFSTTNKPNDCRNTLPKLYQPDDEHMRWNYAAIIDGRIRATVGSYPITLNIAGVKFKTAGIGAVTTHRDYTGKGIMRALMNKALLDMEDDGIQMSALSGLRKRYGYYGYEKCGISYIAEISTRNAAVGEGDGVAYDFVEVHANDSEYLSFIDRIYRSQPWHAERPAESLHAILKTWNSIPYIALKNGSPVGYLICRCDRGLITELFVDDNQPELYNDVVRSFVLSRGVGFKLNIPSWKPGYLREASRFAEEISVAYNHNWRIFDFAGVSQALFEIKRRWSEPCSGGAVVGIDGYGSLSIEASNGVAICELTKMKPDFMIDALTAMRLLFGNLPPEAVYQGPKSALFSSWFPLPLCGLAADLV